jgi:hypothetical protein
MFKRDFDQFMMLLDAVYSLHSKTLPGEAKALYFRALASYPLDVVRAAIDAHVKDPQRGPYPPKPADLIAQIDGTATNDSRPGADEAWAIARSSLDERTTVVWTAEICEAFSIARPVLDNGDEVGGRMAFKDAYNRLVTAARLTRRPAEWKPSLGWDAQMREETIRNAALAGMLPAPIVDALLPMPADDVDYDADRSRANLQCIREQLAALPSALERIAAAREAERLAQVESLAEAKAEAGVEVAECEESARIPTGDRDDCGRAKDGDS